MRFPAGVLDDNANRIQVNNINTAKAQTYVLNPTPGTWYHLVLTWDGTSVITLYINGASVPLTGSAFSASDFATVTAPSVGINLSNFTANMKASWYGFYNNKALSAARVLAHYNAGISPSIDSTTRQTTAPRTLTNTVFSFLSDSISRLVSNTRTLTETRTVSDSTSRSATATRTPFDDTDSYAKTILNDSPYLFWRFDGSGQYVMDHSLINNNYGVDSSLVRLHSGGPLLEANLYASAMNGVVSSASVPVFAFGNDFTLEFWYNLNPSDNFDSTLFSTNDGIINVIQRNFFGSLGTLDIANGQVASFNVPINYGTWNLIQFVWNGASQFPNPILYFNGASVANAIQDNFTMGSSALFTLGNNTDSFDEFAIYTYKLSAAQALAHYNAKNIGATTDTSTRLSTKLRTLADNVFSFVNDIPSRISNAARFPTITVGNYIKTVTDDSPAIFLPLDEKAGATMFRDRSGNGINGLPVNTNKMVFHQKLGIPMGSWGASFIDDNSTSEGAVLCNNLGIASGNPFSVEIWFNMSSSSVVSELFCTTLDIANNRMQFWVGPNYIELSTPGSLKSINTPIGSVSPNTLYHAVATWDGASTSNIYLNGSLSASSTSAFSASDLAIPAGQLRISNQDSPGFAPNGVYANAALYNKVLSANRVLAHYNAGIGSAVVDTPSRLLALLRTHTTNIFSFLKDIARHGFGSRGLVTYGLFAHGSDPVVGRSPIFQQGSLLEFQGFFTDPNQNPVDPGAVEFEYLDPNNVNNVFQYPNKVTKFGIGAYKFLLDTSPISGSYVWRWHSTGSFQATTDDNLITITPSTSPLPTSASGASRGLLHWAILPGEPIPPVVSQGSSLSEGGVSIYFQNDAAYLADDYTLEFSEGQLVTFGACLTDLNGAFTDASIVVFQYLRPDGIAVTYYYPPGVTDANITRLGPGQYQATIDTTGTNGDYSWAWYALGPLQANMDIQSFIVNPTVFSD